MELKSVFVFICLCFGCIVDIVYSRYRVDIAYNVIVNN